jgi:hypothetical protein
MGKSWKKQVEARLEISRESSFPFPIEISTISIAFIVDHPDRFPKVCTRSCRNYMTNTMSPDYQVKFRHPYCEVQRDPL